MRRGNDFTRVNESQTITRAHAAMCLIAGVPAMEHTD
jgi:hypothetical protein